MRKVAQLESHWAPSRRGAPFVTHQAPRFPLIREQGPKRNKTHPQQAKGSVWSIYVLLALWGNLQQKTLLSHFAENGAYLLDSADRLSSRFFFSLLDPTNEKKEGCWKKRACKLGRESSHEFSPNLRRLSSKVNFCFVRHKYSFFSLVSWGNRTQTLLKPSKSYGLIS